MSLLKSLKDKFNAVAPAAPVIMTCGGLGVSGIAVTFMIAAWPLGLAVSLAFGGVAVGGGIISAIGLKKYGSWEEGLC